MEWGADKLCLILRELAEVSVEALFGQVFGSADDNDVDGAREC